MLSVRVSLHQLDPVEEILVRSGFIQASKSFILKTPLHKELAQATLSKETSSLDITFPNNLSLDEYRQIHEAIALIMKNVDGELDDSNSLLGYLKNGEATYIITNWDPWVQFLEDLRYRCLEGMGMRVPDDTGKKLDPIRLW